MPDCIFCKIIKGEIPGTKVYEDEQIFAFRDIAPVAPVHVLIVPKKHIDSVNAMSAEDESTIGHLFFVAKQIAAQENIAQSGYRLIVNTNADAGQAVFHIHLHLLGGKRMGAMV